MSERESSIRNIRPYRESDTPNTRYDQLLNRYARDFIYGDVNAEIIEQRINDAREDAKIGSIEQQRHELGSLLHFIKGIELHERANFYHGGAWQAALIRQPAHQEREPKPSETLTRQEVADEFEVFPFREQILEAERKAVGHYESLLKLHAEPTIALSENISLKKSDIEVLINDLRIRLAERIPDDAERKEQLAELDRQLKEIIEGLAEEDWGKRFELEEIYLIRRLIHAADTGHLVSVSHGTPREDLRSDRGSIDVQITAAGDRLDFQLKTFKRGVHKEGKKGQALVLEKAERHLQGSSTHLVVLEAEAVKESFEAALRRPALAPVNRLDSFETLRPLIDSLEESDEGEDQETIASERHRLLTLLGLTEEDLIAEQKDFQEKQEAAMRLGEEYRAREKEKAEREAQAIAVIAKLRAQEEENARRIELERLQQKIQQQEQDVTLSESERQKLREEKAHTQAERKARREQDREALERIVAERDAKEKEAAEAARKKEEAKLRKEAKKAGWPPPNLVGLANASTLQRIGFLPPEWSSDARQLLEAKKRFLNLFAKPKPKTKAIEDTSQPTKRFAEYFPTRESLEAPSAEDQERIQELLNQSDKQSRAA